MAKKELSVGEAYEYLVVNYAQGVVYDASGAEWCWSAREMRPVRKDDLIVALTPSKGPFVAKTAPLTDEQIITFFLKKAKDLLNTPGAENFYRGETFAACADILSKRELP